MNYGASSKHLANILGERRFTKQAKPSRDSSKHLNKSNNSSHKREMTMKNDVEKYMLSKRRLNKEFLTNAKSNNVDRCLELIGSSRKKNSADINCKDSDGWTALHHAAWNGNLKFLNILLYNDATIGVKDKRGVSPLALSVAKGHSNITQVFFFQKINN